jgi:hypothetical protein
LKNEKHGEFKLFDGVRFTTTYEKIENNLDEPEDVMQ